jgi:hypothetical protein
MPLLSDFEFVAGNMSRSLYSHTAEERRLEKSKNPAPMRRERTGACDRDGMTA